nr:immunoglobulin heavy chain junction region [Mus musculus]
CARSRDGYDYPMDYW